MSTDSKQYCEQEYAYCSAASAGSIGAAIASIVTGQGLYGFESLKAFNAATLHGCFQASEKLKFCDCPNLFATFNYTKIIEQAGLEYFSGTKVPNPENIQKQFTSVKDRRCKCENKSNCNTTTRKHGNLSSNPKLSSANLSSNPKLSTANLSSNPKTSTANLSSNPKLSTANLSGNPKTTTSNLSLNQSIVISTPSTNPTTTISNQIVIPSSPDIPPTEVQTIETQLSTDISNFTPTTTFTIPPKCKNCIQQINNDYLLKNGISFELISDTTYQTTVENCVNICLSI